MVRGSSFPHRECGGKKLGREWNPRWMKYERTKPSNICRRFKPNACKRCLHQANGRNNVGQSLKNTAPTGTVAAVRRTGQRVMENWLRRRRTGKLRTIAEITVRRVNGQAEQHRAQQPCNNARTCCGGTFHAAKNKSQPTESPASQFDALLPHAKCRNVGIVGNPETMSELRAALSDDCQSSERA
jgi:hypothetical protein